MSARLNLKPGHVYFLRMVDASGRYEFPYVKVGITEGAVPRRIDQLQTGNPFEIVAWDSFASEAAQLVERHIHHTYAQRRVRLEWLHFEESELAALVLAARSYSDEVSQKAEAVRNFDLRASNGAIIESTVETRALHSEIVDLLGAQVRTKARFDTVEVTLKHLTGVSGGIDGVTEVSVTNGGRSFSARDFAKAHPAIHQSFCTKEELGCSFGFVGKPRITVYPEENEALKAAKDALVNVDVDAVERARKETRSKNVENMHLEYLQLKAALAEIRGDLVRYELELRHTCGENAGIADICKYVRETKSKFDEEAFSKAHPDLWAEFHVDRPRQRRVKVLASRDYARTESERT